MNLELLEELKKLYEAFREEMQKEWHRDLPFEELIFSRWERANHLGFGKGSSIYHSSYVYGDVVVGKNTWIGPFTILDGIGGLTIGSNCAISAGVQIYTHDTAEFISSGEKKNCKYSPVTIGDHCYIGPNTVVSKGLTIGKSCIIGACSFVNKDLPDYTTVFGVPAKIFKKDS